MNLIKASQSSLETQNSYVNAGLVKTAESPLFLLLLPATSYFAVLLSSYLKTTPPPVASTK